MNVNVLTPTPILSTPADLQQSTEGSVNVNVLMPTPLISTPADLQQSTVDFQQLNILPVNAQPSENAGHGNQQQSYPDEIHQSSLLNQVFSSLL